MLTKGKGKLTNPFSGMAPKLTAGTCSVSHPQASFPPGCNIWALTKDLKITQAGDWLSPEPSEDFQD